MSLNPNEIQHECPLCQHSVAMRMFELATDQVVYCPNCELISAITAPIEKHDIYNEKYFAGEAEHKQGYANYEAELYSHQETFRRRLQAAKKKLGGVGRLLDYGCALGHLMLTAKEEGWSAFGTDLSLAAASRTRQNYALPVFVSDLCLPPVKAGSFDLVTLYDVIEHLPNPVTVLKRLAPLLQREGLLHITTPNVQSLTETLLGKWWFHYKPQEHLVYFSPKTIRLALEQAGFETLEIRSAPSHMTLHDILIRMRVYSRPFANAALAVVKRLGLANLIVKIPIGEMQIWARPKADLATSHAGKLDLGRQNLPVATHDHRVSADSVVDVLCCPVCQGDLKQSTSELNCDQCRVAYPVVNGVPVMLPDQVKTTSATTAA